MRRKPNLPTHAQIGQFSSSFSISRYYTVAEAAVVVAVEAVRVAAAEVAAAVLVGHDREAAAQVPRRGNMCLEKSTLRHGLSVCTHLDRTHMCITQIRQYSHDRYTNCDGG
jgi:hypothetical protein